MMQNSQERLAKILVVEDEDAVRENIHDLLEFEGFDVQSVPNGFEGLQQAHAWLPDLILCDVMMPELDGFEVLAELRRDSSTATLPFIFLTAKATLHDMRTGMNLGADDYLTKPFTKDELLGAVKTRLAHHAAIETQRLRTLSQRLMVMQETERAQIARDLHTEANQLLVGLKMVLETTQRLPQDSNRSKLQNALDLVSDLAKTISSFSFDLRPVVLDDLGLLPALTQYFEQYSSRTMIQVLFRHAGLQQRFPSDVEIAAFRIVQDALNNVAQHTAVNEVRVQVWADDEALNVRVQDQGQGFDLETVLTRSKGVGLTRMHGRASMVNGYLSIESVPGIGTTVQAALPASVMPGSGLSHGDNTRIPAASLLEAPEPEPEPLLLSAPQSVPQSAPDTITIVLADSHDLTRQGMRSVLETEPEFTIVGEATQGRAALEMVGRARPAVLIVDYALPGFNGIDVARLVSRQLPQTRVLVLALHESEAYVLEALKSGATGYALKQSGAGDLVRAVHEVAAGRRYLSPSLSERAIDAYMNLQQTQDSTLGIYGELTSREREVLQWVVDGLTSAEIGDRLNISPRTVEKHRANMMQKLGVRNQVDLVHYALEHGFSASN